MGPEEASARVGDLAMGAAELVGLAAPVGWAVNAERDVPTAAAVPVVVAGAALSGGARGLAPA